MTRRLGSLEETFVRMNEAYGLTVVGVLRLKNGPDPDTLRSALGRLQVRHALLQHRIAPRDRGYCFATTDPVPPIPLTAMPRRHEAHWYEVAQQQLNTHFSVDDAPLMRCFHLSAGEHVDLVFSFHHAIIDGTACANLYHELLTLCNEEDVPLLPPPVLAAVEHRMPPRYRGKGFARRLLPFMYSQIRDEMAYRREGAPPAVPAESPSHILSFTLPIESTRALTRATRKAGVTINSLIAAAMLHAVHQRRTSMPILLRALLFHNLRPYLQPPAPPEEMGAFLSMLPINVTHAASEDLWDLARNVNDRVTDAIEKGVPFLAPRFLKTMTNRMLQKRDGRMATIALSYLGALKLEREYGSIEVVSSHGFITTNPLSPEFSASGHLFRGRLTLDFMYLAGEMSTDSAQAIVDNVASLLQS